MCEYQNEKCAWPFDDDVEPLNQHSLLTYSCWPSLFFFLENSKSFITKSIDMKFQLYIDLLKFQCRYLLPQNESSLSFPPIFSSVWFSRSVVSNCLRPDESQHARPPCPSPTLEFTQTQVQRVGGAIQPSHPLSSPSPPAPNPSQHQSLFQ